MNHPRSHVPFFGGLRAYLTRNDRTEDFYRYQYATLLEKYAVARDHCLDIGGLRLPLLSDSPHPTREEAYYAMEIGDILFPAVLDKYHYVDEGPYEWGAVQLCPGDVVFDCGANIGVFSLLAAMRGAEVYAFEPIEEARQLLQKTLSFNPEIADAVTIVPAALGADEGVAEFTVLPDTLVGSSMVLPQTGRQARVPVTTVDTYAADHGLTVDFLKADIEGAERQMLAGAQTVLATGPKVAVCTYHLPDDPDVLSGLLYQANNRYVLTHKWKKVYGHVPKGQKTSPESQTLGQKPGK